MYISLPTLSRDPWHIFILINVHDETMEVTTGLALTFGPCDVKRTHNFVAEMP